MLSAALNKKMVANAKKRKSNVSETKPKANFAKRVKPTIALKKNVAPNSTKLQTPNTTIIKKAVKAPMSKPTIALKKNVAPKSTKLQTPNATIVKKAVKAPMSTSPKTKFSPKKKGKQNGNVKKQTPGKNIKKSNKQNTSLPKIEKAIESPGESDNAETSENEGETTLVEHKQKNANADSKLKKTSKHGGRRSGMLHKITHLKEKVEQGDTSAIKEVEEIVSKLEKRGDLSKTAKRKLGAFRNMLGKGKLEKAAPKPKAKKVIKKNK